MFRAILRLIQLKRLTDSKYYTMAKDYLRSRGVPEWGLWVAAVVIVALGVLVF